MSVLLRHLFDYKSWANAEVLALVKTILVDAAIEQTKAIRTLNHTLVVDEIFKSHLSGTANPHKATNTGETPSLESLLFTKFLHQAEPDRRGAIG